MQIEIADKTALVTGSGRGIGKAAVTYLAENGANVVVNDLELAPAQETVDEITDAGGTAIAVTADVSDETAVEEMVTAATDEFGTVDILVNNAGGGGVVPFTEKPDDTSWDRSLQTHLYGAIYSTKHVLDGMLDQGYGKVVNVTSIHTLNGIGLAAQYDVAKYSLLGLTKSLSKELGRHGIRVNAVAPGHTETRNAKNFSQETRDQILELVPLERLAEPEEIAHAIGFLAAPASDYVNGHELRIDGGQQPIDSFKHER